MRNAKWRVRILTLSTILLTAGTLSADAQWLPEGATTGPIYYNGGNIGIGTSSPSYRLHVRSSSGTGVFVVQNAFGLFGFGIDGSGGYMQTGSGIPFSIWGGSIRAIYVNGSNGRVGIGTTTPTVAFEVAGDIKANTITGVKVVNAVYQDLAEWVPASENLDAGTVVVLNPDTPNEVMPSRRPYDTTVAGVVSANPGILLGEGSESKEMIATTGRVKVKADASRAAIRIGDLLVSSGLPGFAMRSEPVELVGVSMHRPGTIIGKALEPLESGRGEILVLLSLQ